MARSAEELQAIRDYVIANIDSPASIAAAAKQFGVTDDELAQATGFPVETVHQYFRDAGIPLGTMLTGDVQRTIGTEQGIRQLDKGEDVVAEQIIGTQGDKYVVQAYDAYGQPMGTRLAEPNPSEAQGWLQALGIVGAALGAGAGLESLLGSGASELAAADIALGGAGGSSGAAGLSSGLTVGEAVGVISNPTSLITNPISKGLSDYVISNLGLTGAEALAAKTAVYATVNGTAAELMGGNFKDAATGTVVAAGLQHLPLPTGDLGLTDKNLTFNQITGRIADSVINNVGSALGIKDLTDTKAGEMLTSGATKAVSGGLTAAAMGANSDQILTNMGIQGLVGALGDVKIPFTKLDDTLATELTTGSFAESIDLGDFNTLGADASVTVGATALGNLDASLAGISNNLPVITQKGTATVTVTAADCAKQGKQYDPANGKCIEPSSGIAQILSGITGGLNAPIVAAPVTVQAKVDNCKALGKTYNPSTDQCEDTITSPVNVISSGITSGLNAPIVAAPVIVKSKADECKALGKVYNPVTQLCDDAVVTPPVVTETITVTACGEGATRVNGVCVCSDPSLVYDSAQKKCVAKTAEPPPKPDTPCGVTGQVRDAAGNCGCPAGQVVLNDTVSGTQYCGKPVAKPTTPTCGADQYLDDYNNCTCVDPKKVIDSTTGLCIDTVAGGDGNDTIPTIPFLPNIPSGNTDPGYSPNLKQPWTASRTYTAPPKDYDYFEDPYFQRFGPITYTPPAGYTGPGKAAGGLLSLVEGGDVDLSKTTTLERKYVAPTKDYDYFKSPYQSRFFFSAPQAVQVQESRDVVNKLVEEAKTLNKDSSTTGDTTVRPPKDAAAPLVPPPPAPSTSSTQTTQSSGATTQVPSTVSSNVVPEGYFRNPVQSSGSLSQIAGALNEGEFLPILKDADWYMTRDLQDVPKDLSRTWRDPVSGYGISVDPYRDVSAAAFTYYDPQGRKLRSSIFNPAELYKNAQEFGIDLSGIGELGKKLDAAGVPYKPGQLYAGTGSNLGINFADIAAKKLGSSYDWTQDPFASQKGQSSVERLAELQALAQKLGIDLTKSENLATLSPQTGKGVSRQFVVYTPSSSGSPMYSFYDTQQEADQAAEQYGGTVINLGGKTINAPGGASGGSVRDIMVGYNQGGLAELAMAQGGRTLQPRYLGGITDGMADKVPANIDGRRPAALSDGEFVIPADVVSHLGNGNSSAGAKILYKMMDRIRKARTGTTKQGRQINPDKFLPR